LDTIIQNLLNLSETIFDGINYVLVQGDTTSALALALAAFNRRIKVIHLEAGLRTHDKENPFPEELNRQIISRLASIHLCPTEENAFNLSLEGIKEGVYVVGNTGLDHLERYKERCKYGNKILVTLHRRENHEKIREWYKVIEDLAREYNEYEFILPVHPNPNVHQHRYILKTVIATEPLSREDLLDILTQSSLVITDSGGLQEESSYFNKKCLVCRKITERPESLGQTSFLVNSPAELKPIFDLHIKEPMVNGNCPFGDGKAADQIIQIFKTL
jgi:UDP-N-acetylglucosamine 2-epimerase